MSRNYLAIKIVIVYADFLQLSLKFPIFLSSFEIQLSKVWVFSSVGTLLRKQTKILKKDNFNESKFSPKVFEQFFF